MYLVPETDPWGLLPAIHLGMTVLSKSLARRGLGQAAALSSYACSVRVGPRTLLLSFSAPYTGVPYVLIPAAGTVYHSSIWVSTEVAVMAVCREAEVLPPHAFLRRQAWQIHKDEQPRKSEHPVLVPPRALNPMLRVPELI